MFSMILKGGFRLLRGEVEPKYGLRKLSIGFVSALLGTTVVMVQQVKADTLPANSDQAKTVDAKSSVPYSAGTEDSQSEAIDSQAADSTQANSGASQVNATSSAMDNNIHFSQQSLMPVYQQVGKTGAAFERPTTNNSASDSSANAADGFVTGSHSNAIPAVKLYSSPSRPVKALYEDNKSQVIGNGGYDQAKWGVLDTSSWSLKRHDDGRMWLDSYRGDTQHVIIPNAADFDQASRDEIYISPELIHKLVVDDHCETLAISKTDGKKVAVIDNNVYQGHNGGQLCNAFGGMSGNAWELNDQENKTLTNLDLTNLDVSRVTSGFAMFGNLLALQEVGNLSNWDTHNFTDMSHMFDFARLLTSIGDLSNWDTHNVTNMSFMFNKMPALTNIGNLGNWDTSRVTNMEGMFQADSKLKDLGNLDRWQTGSVTDTAFMFNGMSALTNFGDLSHWDTHNITSMDYMFAGDESLTNIGDLSNWDTHNVTGMISTFDGDRSLTSLGDLSNWDTSKVTNMQAMFESDVNLKDLGNLDHWQTGNVTDMGRMFNCDYSLANIGDLSNWDTHNVTDMNHMFNYDMSLTNVGDLSNWDTSRVTNMGGMFKSDTNLKDLGHLDHWHTGNVTDMSYMFSGDRSLTSLGDLSNWDTSNVTNMQAMFQIDNKLKDLGHLDHWQTGNVTDMGHMFSGDGSLTNVGDLSNWDTHNVTDMSYMFNCDYSLANIGDLSNWDTHNVTDMSYMFNMFNYTFNTPALTSLGDLSNWDTSKVTNMKSMFRSNNKLKDLGNLGHWQTGNVTDMSAMFSDDHSLTSLGDLSNWDTHNVTDISFMFNGMSALTNVGDLSHWNTSKVTNMKAMFQLDSNLKDLGNLDRWQTGNVTDMDNMFAFDSGLTSLGDLSNWDTHSATNMGAMFYDDESLTSLGDLSNWDTHNVTDMSDMFGGDGSVTSFGDLSNWDTSKVTKMQGMFQFDINLKDLGNLDRWQTGNVTDMGAMFDGDGSLTNVGDLSHWDTHNVTDMSIMFSHDESLTSLGDLSNWDTSRVTNMGGMFKSDTNLKDLGNLDRWQTGNVTDMSHMFDGDESLTNIGDLSNWDTHNVTDMSGMFSNMAKATQLSNDFTKWKMNNVTTVRSMFGSSEAQKRFNISNFNLANVNVDASKQAMANFIGTFGSLVIANNVSFPAVDMKAQRTFSNQSVVLTDNQTLLAKTKDNAPVDTIAFVDPQGHLVAFYKRSVFYQDTADTTYDNALSVVKPIVDRNNQQFLQNEKVNGHSLASLYQLQSLNETDPVKYANGTFELVPIHKQTFTVRYVDDAANGAEVSSATVHANSASGVLTMDASKLENNSGNFGYYQVVSVDNLPEGLTLKDNSGASLNSSISDGTSRLSFLQWQLQSGLIWDNATVTVHLIPRVTQEKFTHTYNIHYKYMDNNSLKNLVPEYNHIETKLAGQDYHATNIAKFNFTDDRTYDPYTGMTVWTNWKYTTSSSSSTDLTPVVKIIPVPVSGLLQKVNAISVSVDNINPYLDGDMGSKYIVSSILDDGHVYESYHDINTPSHSSYATAATFFQYGNATDASQCGTTGSFANGDLKVWDTSFHDGFHENSNHDVTLFIAKRPYSVGIQAYDADADKVLNKKYTKICYYDDLPSHFDLNTLNPDPTKYTLAINQSLSTTGKISLVFRGAQVFDLYRDDTNFEADWAGTAGKDAAISPSDISLNIVAKFHHIKVQRTVELIDDDDNGKVITSENVYGDAGTNGKVTLSVPANYVLASGQSIPATVALTRDAGVVQIHLKHKIDSIHRHYKVVEDLPDGSHKTIIDWEGTLYKDHAVNYYGEGGAFINGTGDKMLKENNNVIHVGHLLNNDNCHDFVLGKIDSIPGYTAELSDPTNGYRGALNVWQANDGIRLDLFQGIGTRGDLASGNCAVDVYPDHTFYVKYTPNAESVTYQFVDDDENGQNVGTGKTVTGVFNQTLDTGLIVPIGYELVNGQSLPTTVKLAENMGTIKIHLQHKVDHITRVYHIIENQPDGTQKMIGTINADLYKDVQSDKWIPVNYLNLFPLPKRIADMNNVSSSGSNFDKQVDPTWTLYKVDQFKYFKAKLRNRISSYADGLAVTFSPAFLQSQDLPKDDLMFDLFNGAEASASILPSQDFYIDYERLDGNVTYQLVDDDNNGSVVTTKTFTGKQGLASKITLGLPDDTYVLAQGNSFPKTFTPTTASTTLQIHLKHKRIPQHEDRKLSREIIREDPHTGNHSLIQTVKVSRDGSKDMHTGIIDWGPWTKAEFPPFDVPPVAGYTSSQTIVEGRPADPDKDNDNKPGGPTIDQIHITYKANPQVLDICYRTLDGGLVAKTVINGHTDDVVNVAVHAPLGFVLVVNATPKTFKLTPDVNEIDVLLASPRGFRSYLSGDADLRKTASRLISMDMPDGSSTEVLQNVQFVRNAWTDEHGRVIKYTAWMPLLSGKFATYIPPVKVGYRSDIATEAMADPNNPQTFIQLKYYKLPRTTLPMFIDTQGHTYDNYSEIPDGYVIADGQDENKSGQLIVPYVNPEVPQMNFVTRTVTMTMPGGTLRTINQRVLKGSHFSAIHLPKLRGYRCYVQGSIDNRVASYDEVVTVVFSKN